MDAVYDEVSPLFRYMTQSMEPPTLLFHNLLLTIDNRSRPVLDVDPCPHHKMKVKRARGHIPGRTESEAKGALEARF